MSVRAVAGGAVELLRGASALVYLFWAYYALPALMPGIPRFSPFTASITVLSLVGGAYGAEIVRGGLQAVPRGQFDACRALGAPIVSGNDVVGAAITAPDKQKVISLSVNALRTTAARYEPS